MSIRRKLIISMLAVSVGAVLLTVGAVTLLLIYDMHKKKQQELDIAATLTADRNAASLIFIDNEQAQQNLALFQMDEAIMTACIYSIADTLFAGYQKEGAYACPANKAMLPAKLNSMLVSSQSIIKDDDVIGHIFLVSNMDSLHTYIEKIIIISASIAAVILAVVLIVTVFIQRAITKPIQELAKTAQAVSETCDYTLKANENYTDETAILAHAFNQMMCEVRTRDEELQDANETLEFKVVERTRELEKAMHKAEAANEAKTEFLRNMSHEFRTPLHALISFTSYGIKEHETAERSQLKEYFEVMQNGANRLSRLVNEVLDLAKMEEGEVNLAMQQNDIYALAQKSIELVRPLIEEKQLEFEVRTEEELYAECNADKIMQVITNLLSNAVKFTPKTRSLSLEITHEANATIKLVVIDEGVGIPEEELETVFDSFKQSSRTSTGAGGTGLGLAICRRIIEAHGGKIWAEVNNNNKHGMGTRVIFTLPKVQVKQNNQLKKVA